MVGDRSKEELKSTGRDIFTWLILASVFFIPLQLPVGATSRLSLADLFVVLASPLLLLRFQVVRRAMLIAPLLFPLIMVYGALLGGLVNGQVLAHAMVAKVLGAVVLLFSLLSWLQVAQESDRGIFDLMKAFLLGSVVFTLFGLVEFYAGVSIITVRFIESRFSGGYFDPNHYGALTGVGLMFIAALGKDIFRRDSSIYIVGGILGVGFLLCISRGAWIATVFGILVVVVMRPIKIKAPVIALGVFVVLGVLFSGVLEHLAQDINDRPDNGSHRLELITEGLRLFKDGHFVGIGLSVFLEKNEIIIHNSVVWMTVEMGIVGVALYLLFIGEPVVRLMRLRFRHWRRGGQPGDQIARISASLLGAHLLMAVASQLVEATYQRQWWLVLALTVGLLTRTNVSSTGRLPAYILYPNKLKTSWAKHLRPKPGWPTPWGSLWGNTGIKQEVASGIGRFKPVAPGIAPIDEQGGQYADSSNDTYISDPTVLLSVPISDSILTAYDQTEKEKNHADSANETSIPDVIVIPAEDDVAKEKGMEVDSETQYLPISELMLTDEEQAEQETNRVNNSKDPFVSDVSVILAENDIAIEEGTEVDSETQYLPVQEINHSDSVDEPSTSDAEVFLTEDNIATEKGTEVDSETQYLPISELILTDEEQAEQEMNRINNANDTFIYTAAVLLSENDAEAEEMKEVDSETQYLPIQEMNHSDSTDDSSTSDGEVILTMDDAGTEKETGVDSETQYLPIQEINHSGSTVDPSTSDGEAILAIDDIETEKETDADPETQHLPIQEIDHSDSANDPSIFEVVDTLEEKTTATEKETNADSETQYLPVSESTLINQEMNRLDSINDTSIPDAAVILAENDAATKEETSVDADSKYLPTSDSILIDTDQADQETGHSDGVNKTSIPEVEAIVIEDDIAKKEEKNIDFATNYSQISEPSQMDIDQAEQETIHANGMNDTSISGAENFLVEDIGGARIHHTLNYDIEEIIGIEKQYGQRLREVDIDTTQQLLNKANTSTAITDISNHINKKESLIRTWISMADLIQVPGVRGQFSKLIAQSGVQSIKQLAAQDAHELAEKISDAYEVAAKDLEVTAKGNRYRAEPDIDMVTVWIDAAKKLNRNGVGQETNYLDSTNETSFLNDEVILAEDDIAMEEEASLDAGMRNLPVIESPPIYTDQSEQETNAPDTDGPAETSLLHTEVVLEGNDAGTREEISVDSETQPSADSILIHNDQSDQEMDHSDSTNDTSLPDATEILVENSSETEKETDVETQYLPISESILTDSAQTEQETNCSDRTDDASFPDVEVILAEDDGGSWTRRLDYDIEEIKGIGEQCGQRLREIDIDTTQQLLEKADTSAAITEIGHQLNNEESLVRSWISMADLIRVPGVRGQFAEQMMQSGVLSVKQLAVQDAHELMGKISDAYELAQKNSEVAAKENRYSSRPNIDMITVWIEAAKKLNNEQVEQEMNHFYGANDISLPEAEAVFAEDDIGIEKEMNIDAGKQYLWASDSTRIINDQVVQETDHVDSSSGTSIPVAAMILTEDIAKEKAMNIDSEAHYLPVSELILMDNDRADQETSYGDPSASDAAVVLVENDIATNKETNVDDEIRYLSISESILINNVQAGQDANHLDNTNNTSIPTVAMVLTEDVGDSPKDLRDYAIEEIRGIGKRYGQRLREINIETTLQLLKQANTSAAVVEIGHYINERESLVRAWISSADLMRVPGIRGQFAEQLVLSGVLSVKQLAAQDAQELMAKNLEATAKNNHYYTKPSIDMVTVWIDAAKELNDEV